MNRKGAALILAFAIIAILAGLSSAILTRSASEAKLARKHSEAAQAMWLAEAGVGKALTLLRDSYGASSVDSTPLGAGGYSASIASNPDGTRTITAYGFVPFSSPTTTRVLEVRMWKVPALAPNFFNHALYTAGDLSISGKAYTVTGDVIYGDTITGDTGNIQPNAPTHDVSINPLALLDFDQLRSISQGQGNYHDINHLGGPFPESFWYNEASKIPNIVFIEGNMVIKGNDIAGGFFVVGGKVTYDATLSGNVTINGAIYTRGGCTINGGGGAGLNVDGAIWSDNLTMHGGVNVSYNAEYISAIQGLNIMTRVQVTSWRDTQTPYQLSQ